MAKGRRSDWKPGGGQTANPGGIQPGLVEKIQQMQDEMRKTQDSLATELVTVNAAGGAIQVIITGHQRVQSIKIDPTLVDPNDVGMLEDSLLAAVNDAIEKSQAYAAQRLESVTGGVQIPGLPGLM